MPSRESRPTLTFESLTFSGGTTIALDPTDVVVLVGPNNAGKSAALRDITNLIGPPFEGTVVTSAKLRRVGTANELTDFIRRHSRITGSGPSACYEGDGFVVAADPAHIAASWSCHGNIRDLRTLFCRDLGTEFRIQDSNPVPAIGYQDSRVQPMHSLYFSDTLEERVSGYFRKAFGEDLIVFRLGGNTWPLLVGKKMRPGPDENILSKSYNDRVLNSTTPLVGQGDGMRSFASVILHLLTPLTPSILIIDEPEAYLHPPQARLLGEIIATETSSRVQVIMATHSPDVLQGLLNVAPERLRVLRILRSMNTNIIVELNRDKAKAISADPLMKSSNVLSGVFHKRVIIVESDADSMFYSALLDLEVVHGNQQPDVLFVHANGIHRMVTIVEALAALKVRVDVIVDIDILRQVGLFKEIVCALSGDWSKVDKEARYIKNAIDQNAPKQDPARIKSEIKSILDCNTRHGDFLRFLTTEIKKILREAASPWGLIKKEGRTAIPAGPAVKAFCHVQEYCAGIGLWIVPVGELEGFCRSVRGHGPKWTQGVIEGGSLEDRPDLEEARQFVKKVWDAPAQA